MVGFFIAGGSLAAAVSAAAAAFAALTVIAAASTAGGFAGMIMVLSVFQTPFFAVCAAGVPAVGVGSSRMRARGDGKSKQQDRHQDWRNSENSPHGNPPFSDGTDQLIRHLATK